MAGYDYLVEEMLFGDDITDNIETTNSQFRGEFTCNVYLAMYPCQHYLEVRIDEHLFPYAGEFYRCDRFSNYDVDNDRLNYWLSRIPALVDVDIDDDCICFRFF